MNTEQQAFLEKFGNRMTLNKTERVLYGHDIAAMPNLVKPLIGNTTPDAVVQPQNEEELVEVVRWAYQEGIPITPRGAGSGLAGESLTSGIVLDARRYLDLILETADDGSWVRVQPGVVLDALNLHLSKWGRKIGPDPSSSNRAVIGGVVANNATGAHSLQYGYIADFVESIQVVLADGT